MKKILVSAMIFVLGLAMSVPEMSAERPGRGNNRTEQRGGQRPGRNNNQSNRPGRPNNQGVRPGQNNNQGTRPGQSFRPGSQVNNHKNQGMRPGNQSVRPGNQGVRPGQNNQGYRPGTGVATPPPASNNRPGQNAPGFRPGNQANHNSHGVRPGQNSPGFRPGNHGGGPRPGVAVAPLRPGVSRPPVMHRPYRPGLAPARPFFRPAPPRSWRPPVRRVSLWSNILGVTIGMTINNAIDRLLYDGYTVSGYNGNEIYLSNVPLYNYYWPDATMYYDNGALMGSRFYYSTYGYDLVRYRQVYSYLNGMYGVPVSTANNGQGMSATWYGSDNQFITLDFAPVMTDAGRRYFTTVSIGL